MKATEPGRVIELFARFFNEGNLDGIVSLYEDAAVFPSSDGKVAGLAGIRDRFRAYFDGGAKMIIDKTILFSAGDLALMQNAWTFIGEGGSTSHGVSAEVVRRQPDGSWKYVIDSPNGAALLGE